MVQVRREAQGEQWGPQRLAWYQCDHLGTPMELTDDKGKIVWEGDYKAFGKAKATSFDGFTNNLRFQGQYWDEETGLHYNRYRYYDPMAGRYVSKDPIGLEGGANQFGYVSGNPLNDVDPTGLLMLTVGGNVRIPFIGGATHSLGISYFNGQWDAGLIVNADIPLLSAGKMMGRASVDVGLQSGDFCTNEKSYQQNFQAGYKALGGSIQRDENGVSGGGISVGPQLGVSVSGQSSSTLSIRKDLLPFVSRSLNR
jgi:RHS repeat-associated protein